eukprot:Clim_evm14s218 gene=Clim_evmTU14s218
MVYDFDSICEAIDNDGSVVPVSTHRKILRGPVRRPHNDLQEQEVGGDHKALHDEDTAAKLGFKQGAPIHGTVHWSQFTPLALKAFGTGWFDHGSISVHFTTPVSHLEPTIAYAGLPQKGQTQVAIWMNKDDAKQTRVLIGTISVDPSHREAPSMVENRLKGAKTLGPGDVPILMRFKPGEETALVRDVGLDFEKKIGGLFPYTIEQKNKIITEPSPWFTKESGGSSPWGKALLSPELFNALFFYTFDRVQWPEGGFTNKKAVGMFGGCECKWYEPLFVGDRYDCKVQIVAVGETKGTEWLWARHTLYRPGTNVRVGEMLLQQMALKRSYPNYVEERAKAEQRKAKM